MLSHSRTCGATELRKVQNHTSHHTSYGVRGVVRVLAPWCGENGRKRARCRHACSNAEKIAGSSRIIHASAGRVTRYYGGPAALLLPGRFPQPRHVSRSGHKHLIALAPPYCRPICPNHVASIGEGISRAGANSVFHSVEADQARARRSTVGETSERAELPMFPSKKTRVGGGGRETKARVHISRSSLFFAARFEKPVAQAPRGLA